MCIVACALSPMVHAWHRIRSLPGLVVSVSASLGFFMACLIFGVGWIEIGLDTKAVHRGSKKRQMLYSELWGAGPPS